MKCLHGKTDVMHCGYQVVPRGCTRSLDFILRFSYGFSILFIHREGSEIYNSQPPENKKRKMYVIAILSLEKFPEIIQVSVNLLVLSLGRNVLRFPPK